MEEILFSGISAVASLIIRKLIEIARGKIDQSFNYYIKFYAGVTIEIYDLIDRQIKKIKPIRLSSFKISQSNLSRIVLTPESQVHFEELSEEIRESEEDKRIARLKIWRLLVLEMWLQEKYTDKIWLPYLSKIWLFVETQIMGVFSRF